MLLHSTLGIWKIMDPLKNVMKSVDPRPINRKCPAPLVTKPAQGTPGTPGTQADDGEGTEWQSTHAYQGQAWVAPPPLWALG